jgi:hypothetical protein
MFPMIRTVLAMLALSFASLSAQALTNFGAGQIAPKADRPDESRGAIIDRIKANQERVRKLLGDNDSGAETRRLQRQIAADLAKLLESPDEPNPPPPGANSPRSNQPPAGREDASRQSVPSGTQKTAPQAKPGEVGPSGMEGRTPAQESPTPRPVDGRWGELPERLRKEIDAYPRDRMMPRYEELLRAYFRTLAERSPNREGDQP